MDERARRSRRRAILAVVVLALALSACAAGPNAAVGTADEAGRIAGFWMGLRHGVITPITFVVSLFNENVNVYDVHNNGNLYNLGYVIGAVFLIGGSSHGARSAKR